MCLNRDVNMYDNNGLLSIGDIVSIIPAIGTLYNLIVTPKGAKKSDYRIEISKKLCDDLGCEAAELACTTKIESQKASYLGIYVATTGVHEIIDAVTIVAIKHPYVLAFFGIDAVVDFLTSLAKIGYIDKGAEEAMKDCDCCRFK